jgi:hypothetical protein
MSQFTGEGGYINERRKGASDKEDFNNSILCDRVSIENTLKRRII